MSSPVPPPLPPDEPGPPAYEAGPGARVPPPPPPLPYPGRAGDPAAWEGAHHDGREVPAEGRGAWGASGVVAYGCLAVVTGLLGALSRLIAGAFVDVLDAWAASKPELPSLREIADMAPQALTRPPVFDALFVVLPLVVFFAGIGAVRGSDRGRRFALLGLAAVAVGVLADSVHEQTVRIPFLRSWFERLEQVQDEIRASGVNVDLSASALNRSAFTSAAFTFLHLAVIALLVWGLSTRAARERCGAK